MLVVTSGNPWPGPVTLSTFGDFTRPHSVAAFVRESLAYQVFAQGLPAGVDPVELEKRLGGCTGTLLEPLGRGEIYFGGGFPAGGRIIRTMEGVHLFTLSGSAQHGGSMAFTLRFEPAALELVGMAGSLPV